MNAVTRFVFAATMMLLQSCRSDAIPTLQVYLPSHYYGWVYMVESREAPIGNRVDVDTFGVGYIPFELLKGQFEVEFFRGSDDITDLIRGHSSGEATWPLDGGTRGLTFRYGAFFVPLDEDHDTPSGDAEVAGGILSDMGVLESLIREGKVKIDSAQ